MNQSRKGGPPARSARDVPPLTPTRWPGKASPSRLIHPRKGGPPARSVLPAILALLVSVFLHAGAPEEPSALALQLKQEAIAFAEARTAGLTGTYKISARQTPMLPKLPPGEVSYEISHLSKQDPVGQFFAVFRLRVNGRPLGTVRVDLEGKWSGTILRTRTALARKSVPEVEQLEELAFEGQPPPGAITTMPKGFRIKNPVSAGHILIRADLEPIPIIVAGDRVRLTLFTDCLSVSMEGIARSSAALGEPVRVELAQAKRQIQALVQGPGIARAEWK